MSIKNLFGKSVPNYEDVASDVESTKFIDEVVSKQETYIPPVDFSDPSNFVFYGSARLYYEAAIKRIYEDYPYDGSKAEQIEFEEKSSFLERWLFDNKYPKTTGHVQLGTSGDIGAPVGAYATTTTPEYIKVWGGLHTDSAANNLGDHFENSAKYDSTKNRNQNWNCDFAEGVTVEFWLKKTFSPAAQPREVVLDLWNGEPTLPISDYGRLIISLEGATSTTGDFVITLGNSTVQITSTPIDFSDWSHYAISFKENSTGVAATLYVNGEEYEPAYTFVGALSQFAGKMDGYIGALQEQISPLQGAPNAGKLSAQLDEFRFWKTLRTPRQIKMNWFREIGGGANTDDNTSDLGVYLKFNEGITGQDSIDSIVLDYSGRLANGTWEGYSNTTGARSVDSAMSLAGYSESPSPIIYSAHPDVASLELEMVQSGSAYDAGRGQAFYKSLPNWLTEEDELEGDENLRKLTHILASYMDTLRTQIDSLASLQDKNYLPDGYKPAPFASELLTNKGFVVSDMFLTAEVFEAFDSVDYENNKFDLNLEEVKNLIYTNIYNNLENILSSKGTERSIRNLVRCFGIDDELLKLNQYTDGGTQYLGDKYRTTTVKKKYVNLNSPDLFEATLYQSGSRSFISGSHASTNGSKNAFTLEADILVPYKKEFGESGFFATPFLSASVMGFHEANPSNNDDYTWSSDAGAEARDLQVYLVRDSQESKHAKFVVKNQSETIYVTSSYVYDIYENEHYNVALRIKPQTYPYAGNVTNTTPDYDIDLYAVSHNFDEIKEEVLISTTVDNATGSAYMVAPKRVYAGAHYENFTGSLLQSTDLQFGRVSAWLDYIDNNSVREHNKDILSFGPSKSIDGATAFSVADAQVPTQELSILNWDFDTVTISDSSGEFTIDDTTSGSTDTIYGWIDDIIRREHTGAGKYFLTESSAFLEQEFLYANKKQLPETSFNSSNVFLKGDQEIFFGEDDDVSDNLFVLEKSPAGIVSEDMLKIFSTTQEFSNLFGRHIDRYRIEYKDLAKARQLYFEKADTSIDFDKFFTYFKWIDASISTMINQLVPASVNFAGGITDVIEPHILERDKYQRQVGLLQTVTSTEASMRGVQELDYNWRVGHAPVSGLESENSLWQKERVERDSVEREQIRQVLVRQNNLEQIEPVALSGSTGIYSGSVYATRRFSKPYRARVEFSDTIHGGINYEKTKDRDLLRSGIGLNSDVGASGAPKNVVTFGAGPDYGLNTDDWLKKIDTLDPRKKIKYDGFGVVGKFTDFAGIDYPPLDPSLDYYSRRKISHIFPGNVVSSSVNTGYAASINNSVAGGGYKEGVNVVNLHSDTTDISNEISIQGPFTERWIGGHQSRHVELNSVGKPERYPSGLPNGLDSAYSRPEAWRLLIGKNPLVTTDPSSPAVDDGALGFTPPDYGIGQDGNFPDEDRLYAVFYREERAKRPVNIKNIQTTTSSVYHGNYQHEYEVMSTFGDQGYFLRRADNLLPDSIAETLPETTNYHTLIAQTASVAGNYFGADNNRQFETVLETPLTNAVARFVFDQTQQPEDSLDTLSLRVERANYVPNSGNNDTRAIIFNFDVSATNANVTLTPDAIQVDIDVITGDWTSTLTAFEDACGVSEIQPYLSLINTTTGEYRFEEVFLLGDDGNGGNVSADAGMFSGIDPEFASGASEYSYVTNMVETQDRSTGSAHVIRTRFSAPGGPEVNSSAYLDIATQQYSVHNSINFRNLSVRGSGSGEQGTIRLDTHADRRDGLRTLRARHQGQFGIDSEYGAVSSADYNATASYHKQHRNGRRVAIGQTDLGVPIVERRYDNDNFNSPLPASDFGYSWINSAISGSNWEEKQTVLTYAPKNGIMSSSIGIMEALVFPTISDISCCADPFGVDFSITYDIQEGTATITSSKTITVVESPSSNPEEIYEEEISKAVFNATYSGCCDPEEVEYRITSDDGEPLNLKDTGYQSTPPSIPGPIFAGGDKSIEVTFYVKDCENNIATLVLTLQNANF